MAIKVLDEVIEGDTKYLTVAFFDDTGLASTPASVQYKIDCLTTGTSIMSLTNAGAPGTTMKLTITPAQNAIINRGNAQETKRITVEATYAGSQKKNGYFDYLVIALDPSGP